MAEFWRWWARANWTSPHRGLGYFGAYRGAVAPKPVRNHGQARGGNPPLASPERTDYHREYRRLRWAASGNGFQCTLARLV